MNLGLNLPLHVVLQCINKETQIRSKMNKDLTGVQAELSAAMEYYETWW